MAIWLPNKAKAYEMKIKTTRPTPNRQCFCRICGKPIFEMEYCQSCRDFINHKRHEERRKKNDTRRIKNDNRKPNGNTC